MDSTVQVQYVCYCTVSHIYFGVKMYSRVDAFDLTITVTEYFFRKFQMLEKILTGDT